MESSESEKKDRSEKRNPWIVRSNPVSRCWSAKLAMSRIRRIQRSPPHVSRLCASRVLYIIESDQERSHRELAKASARRSGNYLGDNRGNLQRLSLLRRGRELEKRGSRAAPYWARHTDLEGYRSSVRPNDATLIYSNSLAAFKRDFPMYNKHSTSTIVTLLFVSENFTMRYPKLIAN